MCTCTHSPRLSQQQSLVPSFWCVEPMFQLCSAAEWKWPLVQAPVRFIKIKTRCWRTWRPAQLNILLLAKWNAVWNGHVNDTFCLCWLPCCIGWFSGHSTITCCHNGTGGCFVPSKETPWRLMFMRKIFSPACSWRTNPRDISSV